MSKTEINKTTIKNHGSVQMGLAMVNVYLRSTGSLKSLNMDTCTRKL